MNDELAKILGEMVCLLKRTSLLNVDSFLPKLQALAEQVQITNTEKGPVASGIKPPKTKFKVTMEAEVEIDQTHFRYKTEEEVHIALTEILDRSIKGVDPSAEIQVTVEPKKKTDTCDGHCYGLCPECSPDPKTVACISCGRETDYYGYCPCEGRKCGCPSSSSCPQCKPKEPCPDCGGRVFCCCD